MPLWCSMETTEFLSSLQALSSVLIGHETVTFPNSLNRSMSLTTKLDLVQISISASLAAKLFWQLPGVPTNLLLRIIAVGDRADHNSLPGVLPRILDSRSALHVQERASILPNVR